MKSCLHFRFSFTFLHGKTNWNVNKMSNPVHTILNQLQTLTTPTMLNERQLGSMSLSLSLFFSSLICMNKLSESNPYYDVMMRREIWFWLVLFICFSSTHVQYVCKYMYVWKMENWWKIILSAVWAQQHLFIGAFFFLNLKQKRKDFFSSKYFHKHSRILVMVDLLLIKIIHR